LEVHKNGRLQLPDRYLEGLTTAASDSCYAKELAQFLVEIAQAQLSCA
jgi:hypothetical protein